MIDDGWPVITDHLVHRLSDDGKHKLIAQWGAVVVRPLSLLRAGRSQHRMLN